ncbi:MAG TPA: aminotransferase class IV [Blastocatellia bacterium]|jgi:branched-subunit amino acid aminotransferase/4-amino-4-deoxychorismate lyase
MDRLIYHNERIIDAAEADIAPTLAGLLYGWGVFTTLRIYGGSIFAFERHWERILRHAEKARVSVPLEGEQAARALDQLIAANSTNRGRARLTILKGEAGSWRGVSDREADVLIFTSPDLPRPKTDLAITISPYRLLSTSQLAGIKQTAMLENLFALEEARGRGYADGVMLNERGEIVSTTAANIFWVQGDEVFTPSLATGCVAGVTRRFVQEIAARWQLHLVEGSFTVQRLHDAREVFLTSTAHELAIVSSFDMTKYAPKDARIARLISREFQKFIKK